MTDAAITLPLDVERLVRMANYEALNPNGATPEDHAALELAEDEVAEVKRMLGR